MKKLIYIIVLLTMCNVSAQHEMMLQASRAQFANEGAVLPTNYFPTGTPASPIGESSSLTGWGGLGNVYLETTEKYAGDYSIKFVSPYDASSANLSSPEITLSSGNYTAKFWIKQTAGNAAIIRNWDGVYDLVQVNVNGGAIWTEYQTTFTIYAASANITMKIFLNQTTPQVGDTFYVDSISIIKDSEI